MLKMGVFYMNYKNDFVLPESIEMDLEIKFNDVVFKIVEELTSNTYLVVKKKDYEDKKFPLQTYIIPINN